MPRGSGGRIRKTESHLSNKKSEKIKNKQNLFVVRGGMCAGVCGIATSTPQNTTAERSAQLSSMRVGKDRDIVGHPSILVGVRGIMSPHCAQMCRK